MSTPDATKSATTDGRLLRLDARDNVLTVIQTLAAGESVAIEGARVVLERSLPLGHKVAAGDIPTGGKIIKYGVAIGSATAPIRVGEHVHTHNLRSDYFPTYLLATQAQFFQQHA